MSPDQLLILLILAAAVVLFVTERLRVDVVALLVLASLVLTGLLSPLDAFAGFASPAVVTVWAVFIISGALVRSGVADRLARLMMRLAADSEVRLLVVIMITAGLMSAVMNNIGAVAILLPAVVSIGRQSGVPPSRLLIPLAFSALLGGNLTLIGTPPNILASSLLEDYGSVEAFRFFDFAPMGAVVLVGGILYMVLVGRHLLPSGREDGGPADSYPRRAYLTEVRIAERSPLAGQTVAESNLASETELSLIRIATVGGALRYPSLDRKLQVGDTLLVEGPLPNLLPAIEQLGLEMVPRTRFSTVAELAPEASAFVEVALSNRSAYAGMTLAQIDFRRRYGCTVLAIHHGDEAIISRLGKVPLSFGDALLVEGPVDRLNMLRADDNFLVLDMPPLELRRFHKAPQAVAILLATLGFVVFGPLDVATTLLLGALAMVLSGVLTMDEAYGAIDWKSIFLIAGMLPLGTAMADTGTAAFLADRLIALVGGASALYVLGGLFVLTALLTEVISNAAATVLVVPIAIDAALALGANPHPFVMATVLAASTSFLMPIGHQVNVIVYGPGGYRFSDYTRVGVGLNLLLLALVISVLPIFWPLFP